MTPMSSHEEDIATACGRIYHSMFVHHEKKTNDTLSGFEKKVSDTLNYLASVVRDLDHRLQGEMKELRASLRTAKEEARHWEARVYDL